MPETSTSATAPAPRLTRPLLILLGFGVVLVSATSVLWAYYGTTVFYEMIVAGLAACL
jgi:hypothetical protein